MDDRQTINEDRGRVDPERFRQFIVKLIEEGKTTRQKAADELSITPSAVAEWEAKWGNKK